MARQFERYFMSITRRNSLKLAGTAALGAAMLPASTAILKSAAHAEDGPQLMEGEQFLGNKDASVKIFEYASLTCGHCADFHEKTWPAIKEKYVDTGKVMFVIRNFPFDPRAFAGAMLAKCADSQFYYPMMDVLFTQQRTWAGAQDPRPPLLQIAKLAGFTQESFEACLKNQEVLDSVNSIKNEAADKFGVDATPTFFINGEKHAGNMSVEEFSALIDKDL
jgi:protein-disulfide isomerase